MIATVNMNLPSPPCQPTGCGQKSTLEIPDGARHPSAKEDHVKISNQAREQLNTRINKDAAVKSENDLREEDRRQTQNTPAGITPNPFSGTDNSPRTGHNLNIMI